MRRTYQNYVSASSATTVPMEIGAIGKSGGKGKGKGKFKSGKWESGWDYGSRKGGKEGKEAHRQKGKSPKGGGCGAAGSDSEKFSGFCGRGGKKGHRQKDCWAKVVGSVEAQGEEAPDTKWHEGDDGGWWNTGWWGEQAAVSPAPGTLAPVTNTRGRG